ncbi:sigma-54 interaction domain-containing protein [Methylibium rhizosphaerae]|uniref:sigma-54 interaction domain-containing protein n=1 Tax=Methylibium rhizosphaerae TaxID=2570323 RepID=UPI00112B6A4B|nr:sigma 54-interacting transcriptional regulator [Methylibium rhizosphaerae]
MQIRSSANLGLIGRNRTFDTALSFARKAARHDCPLLIVGETGTGKDEVARLVHAHSTRASGPFVSLNCAALPEALIESELFGYERGAFTGAGRSYAGRFVAADGGTLFLDELGDLPLASQAKLLRAIEHREVTPLGSMRARKVDLRIVAATHQPLEAMVRERRFREDLFYRLSVARVQLPPLRERRDDILELAAHFMAPLKRSADGARVGWFDAVALECLLAHRWPGNVRELRNVIESIFIDPPDGPITLRSLPAYLAQPFDDPNTAAVPGRNERQRILDTLLATHWNKAAAARELKWSRVTLYRKMAKHAIPCASEAQADPVRSHAG